MGDSDVKYSLNNSLKPITTLQALFGVKRDSLLSFGKHEISYKIYCLLILVTPLTIKVYLQINTDVAQRFNRFTVCYVALLLIAIFIGWISFKNQKLFNEIVRKITQVDKILGLVNNSELYIQLKRVSIFSSITVFVIYFAAQVIDHYFGRNPPHIIDSSIGFLYAILSTSEMYIFVQLVRVIKFRYSTLNRALTQMQPTQAFKTTAIIKVICAKSFKLNGWNKVISICDGMEISDIYDTYYMLFEVCTLMNSVFSVQLSMVSGPFFSTMGSGCALSFSATLLPLIMQPSSDILVTSDMASWIASIIVIGSLTGTVMGPFIMNKLGYKKTLFLSTIPPLIGWCSISYAQSAIILLLAKLLQGFGVGVAVIISSIYVGEITTPKYRGAFISLVYFGLTLGIFSGHFIGSLVPWRTASIVCSIFNILTFFICPFSVESPSWLVSRSKFDESEKVFGWLRGDGEATLKEFNAMVLAQKMKSAKEKLSNTTCGRNFFRHLTRMTSLYKPLTIVAMLALAYHGTGFDVILNAYCIIILKQLIDTNSNIDVHTIMLSFDIIKLVASVLAIYLIRVSNRRCVLIANMLVTMILVLLFIFSYLKSLHITIFYSNYIFIGLLCLFAFFMYVGIVSFSFPIAGEIFPMAYKPIGMSLAGLISSLVLFATLKIVPAMLDRLGLHGTFLVYALVGLITTLYLYFHLPETKGKTLQEIEEYFTGEVYNDLNLISEMDLMTGKQDDGNNK